MWRNISEPQILVFGVAINYHLFRKSISMSNNKTTTHKYTLFVQYVHFKTYVQYL